MKLTAKLVSILLLGVILLLAIDAYVSIRHEAESFEANMRCDAILLGRAMKGLVADSWNTDGGARALRLIEDANAEEDEVSIRWVWLDAATDSEFRFRPRTSKESLEPVVRGQELSMRSQDEEGFETLRTYVPVALEEHRPGAIELSESLSELNQDTRHSLIRTITLMVVLLAVSGFLVVPLGIRMVGRPLRQLVEKTRRVGVGDLSGPLHLRGHDEITEVAAALNTMCEQLAESQEQVLAETAARISTLEQLRHADRINTVGRLAAGMAHELGSPLNVVSARGALIAEGALSIDEIIESGNIIKAQSDRITAIVRQLLDFARRSDPQRQPSDLRQLAGQTIKLLTSFATKNKATISLVDHDSDATIEVDAGQIQQVLTNLIVNSVQAMPNGGTVNVAIDQKHVPRTDSHEISEEDFLCLSVRDEGLGISEENKQLLFEPFFTTKDVGEGTGLGLSIAYGIVSEHGGWIDVASEPGKGSCFSVYLPREVLGPTTEP